MDLIKLKFKKLPGKLESQIKQMDIPALLALSEAIINADTLEDIA